MLIGSTVISSAVYAKEMNIGANHITDLSELSLEDLLNIEIMVTAQKREEDLMDVPISVSVISGRGLEKQQLYNIETIQARVPSLTYRKGTTTRNSALTIRGIGTISYSIAAEPSVSMVVDGVVMARSGQAFTDLYDIERIEILQGPQGTLFGKNSSAGVVNIITNSPTNEFYSTLDVVTFEDQEYRVSGTVSGAISDSAMLRITGYSAYFDGHIKNVFNEKDVNGYQHQSLRSRLDWYILEDLTLRFSADFADTDDDCCGELIGTIPSNAATLAGLGSAEPLGDETREVNHNFVTTTKDETWGVSMQVDWALENFVLTSITAYREWDNTELRDGDFLSSGASHLSTFELHDTGTQQFTQFSQELRVTSPMGQEIEWLAGVFAWDVNSDRRFTRDDIVCTATLLSADNTGELPCAVGSSTFTQPSATATMSSQFKNLAAFGTVTWNIAETWRLLFGLRYTRDEVNFTHNRSNNSGGIDGPGVHSLPFSATGETDNSDRSGKFGLQYDLATNVMTYFTYTQGYKGPAFNVFFNMTDKDLPPISAETSDAFEIGAKVKLLDGHMNLNVALFSAEYNNFQANNFEVLNNSVVTRLTNAGSVETQGAEIDLVGQITADLRLSAGLAYTDARIKEFKCPLQATGCTSRKGEELALSPDYKLGLAAEYRLPLDTAYNVYLDSQYSWLDEQYSSLGADPGTLIGAYGIWDASVRVVSPEKKYRVSFYIKNVLDKSYASLITPGGPGDSNRYHIPRNAERFFGISMGVSWN